MLARRPFLMGAAAAGVARPAFAADALTALEQRSGGKLGVFAVESRSGRVIGHRQDERVLMCSTFKALLAGAVLARVDAGQERLDRRVPIAEGDLLDYAPAVRAHLAEGTMTVGQLCAGMVELSDNSAANLLLATLDGPAGLTRFLRGIGDPLTRLDRTEPALNVAHGELDTTTPRRIAETLRVLLLGEALRPASRAHLEGWMVASPTGRARLRAGLPEGWRVGDKTGTGGNWANVVAIIHPPGQAPILAASYLELPGATGAQRDAVHREVGAILAAWAR
ncbi:class A beta-lactamase [Roseococcus sp. YIM B11640]|uniref:class A beta-lactamase n=1 Tax=Roseococcus sp. YIM B11640 TaxID=3133973 RepID=UPI003C7A7DAD